MAPGERTILYVSSAECIGCDACEQACASRHGVARMRRAAHAPAVGYPSACRHCEQPLCVEGCISGAMQRDAATGQVVHDRRRCVGCWSCIMACPFGAVRRDLRDGPVSARCDRCAEHDGPACVAACTTGALRHVPAQQLPARAEAAGTARPFVRFLLCAALPLLGLALGMLLPQGAALNHQVGKTAATLVLAAFVLPLAGRPVWGRMRRARWTRLHVAAGVSAAAVALAHTAGRLGLNIQTAAALTLYAMVLVGATYLYLRPPLLLVRALLQRHTQAADGPTGPGQPLERPDVLRATREADARRARSWAALTARLDRLTAACRPAHIVLAILALGFIIAHAVIMVIVGAGNV